MDFPSIDFGGSGQPLLFLHANGYPPACYLKFLDLLSRQYHVTAFLQRPLWPGTKPDEIVDWLPLTDDLLGFLKQNTSDPQISIGHSMGGVAILRAALQVPDRFKAIILLDPVLFPPTIIRLWQVIHRLRLEKRVHPLIPLALNRRQYFKNLDLVFKGYRQKEVFKYFDDIALKSYIQGITAPFEDGYKLRYSAEWESHIYATSVWRDMDIWRGLHQLKIPALILRGQETDTFLHSTAYLVNRKNRAVRIEVINKATHLLPLEQPEKTSELILSFLKEAL